MAPSDLGSPSSADVTAIAIHLLAERGYDATSVDELAEALEVSRSTFFRRFGTKEDIYNEVRDIIDTFGDAKGGLIAELFDFELMGWKPKDPKNSEYCKQAFIDLQ